MQQPAVDAHRGGVDARPRPWCHGVSSSVLAAYEYMYMAQTTKMPLHPLDGRQLAFTCPDRWNRDARAYTLDRIDFYRVHMARVGQIDPKRQMAHQKMSERGKMEYTPIDSRDSLPRGILRSILEANPCTAMVLKKRGRGLCRSYEGRPALPQPQPMPPRATHEIELSIELAHVHHAHMLCHSEPDMISSRTKGQASPRTPSQRS